MALFPLLVQNQTIYEFLAEFWSQIRGEQYISESESIGFFFSKDPGFLHLVFLSNQIDRPEESRPGQPKQKKISRRTKNKLFHLCTSWQFSFDFASILILSFLDCQQKFSSG
jgi:hypothetical protein